MVVSAIRRAAVPTRLVAPAVRSMALVALPAAPAIRCSPPVDRRAVRPTASPTPAAAAEVRRRSLVALPAVRETTPRKRSVCEAAPVRFRP